MLLAPFVITPRASASAVIFLTFFRVEPAATATSSRVISGVIVGEPSMPASIRSAFAPSASMFSLENATSIPLVSSVATTSIVFMPYPLYIFFLTVLLL